MILNELFKLRHKHIDVFYNCELNRMNRQLSNTETHTHRLTKNPQTLKKKRRSAETLTQLTTRVPRVELALRFLSLITLPSQLKTDTIHHHTHTHTKMQGAQTSTHPFVTNYTSLGFHLKVKLSLSSEGSETLSCFRVVYIVGSSYKPLSV